MAVFRVERNTGYTVMSNHHLRNKETFPKAKGLLSQFTTNHPKLPAFFKAASSQIGEGSIIEISVTTAEGKNLCTNMKVRPEDMQLVEELKNLSK